MINIQGKYNTAICYTDYVEYKADSQIRELCAIKALADSKIRIMPDVHYGSGCTVGTTITITDKVIPSLVGSDIGCGMLATKVKQKSIDYQEFDDLIRAKIPFGSRIQDKGKAILLRDLDLRELKCFDHVNTDRALRSIGTLGGGNHFIEIDKDEDGFLWIVIHSGSRFLGLEIAKYYQDLAWKARQYRTEALIQQRTKDLIKIKQEQDINFELKKLKDAQVGGLGLPTEMSWLEGINLKDYLSDIKFAQYFASKNRETMTNLIVKGMNLDVEDQITTIHNYIDTEANILRKGSISAKDGEKVIIPMNMRDGSLLCLGKGNADWNYSAPHGAGRILSRGGAKDQFSMEQYKKAMKGIFSTSISEGTLDESPMAYKSMAEIMEYIKPTVSVIQVIKPKYNFKAGN